MSPAALLQDYLQRFAVELTAHSEKAAQQWAKLSSRTEQALLRILDGSTEPASPQEAARILAELRKVLGGASTVALRLADTDALSVMRLGYGSQADYFAKAYGARDALSVRAGRIAQTFRRYDGLLQDGAILRGPYWQIERGRWAREFEDRAREVTGRVQRDLTKAIGTTGETTPRDIAASVRPLIEGSTGRMDAETWARSFARTNQQQLYGDFAEQLAIDAGIDKFINVGVPDDRQSQECYEASQQPPMTMAEWDGWTASNGKGGRPGSRHVFNCRCIGGAVPPGLEDDDWAQPNPKYEEVAV